MNDDLAVSLTSASVRTEAFVTVVVSEATMARSARQAGRGLTGRARVLYGLLGEVEAHLLGAVRCSSVDWLDSQALAAAVRTGFAPGDRAVLVQAAADAAAYPGTQTGVPWAVAGPGQASTPVRWYEHDAWKSVSAAVLLPDRGAILGALAPVLVPGSPGERRCYTVFYPLVSDRKAARSSASAEISAATGGALRKRLGQQTRARQRRNEVQTHAVDAKLARGRAMVRPAAVASVTVPGWWAGRRLRPAAGVGDPARRLHPAAPRPGRRLRVHRLRHPPRGRSEDVPECAMSSGKIGRRRGRSAGGRWGSCSPTTGTRCRSGWNPSRRSPRRSCSRG